LQELKEKLKKKLLIFQDNCVKKYINKLEISPCRLFYEKLNCRGETECKLLVKAGITWDKYPTTSTVLKLKITGMFYITA